MRNRDDGWKAALGKVGPQSHRRLAARCRPSAPSRGWPVSGSWHWVVNDCNCEGYRMPAGVRYPPKQEAAVHEC